MLAYCGYLGWIGLGYHVPQLLSEKEGIIPVSSIGSNRFAVWPIHQSYWWLSLCAPKHGQIMLGMWPVWTCFLNTSSVTTLHVHLKYPKQYDRYFHLREDVAGSHHLERNMHTVDLCHQVYCGSKSSAEPQLVQSRVNQNMIDIYQFYLFWSEKGT